MTNQIYKKAKDLFYSFEEKTISIDTFEQELIKLANINPDFEFYNISFFINEYIIAQFNSYKENPVKNAYLLSVHSSGSLLNQFEPYTE